MCIRVFFFFFKHKTAYEMRISDWSSDVCSSDLKRRILPALSVIDRACSEAIARANRRVYRALVEPLTDSHRAKLDELLKLKAGSSITWLTWLRQAPLKPNSRHMLEHIERLKTFQLVDLPEGLGRHIHQNRLLKLAREGGQMTPKDLGKFEPQRRYATLAAVVLESTATVIDELVDLHDRDRKSTRLNSSH